MRKLMRTLALVASLLCLSLPPRSASGAGATFTVNSTADPGDGTCNAEQCTLREALLAAAASGGTDTVAFDIPDTDLNYGYHTPGVWTIVLGTKLAPLPNMSEVIDGTSQPVNYGSDTNPYGPEIEISGENLAAGQDCWSVGALSNNTMKGLVINRCPAYGLMIQGQYNLIIGNYVGTDATGSTDQGAGLDGIALGSGAANNTIGGAGLGEGNLLSGNRSGVRVYGSSTHDNVIVGNLMGTDRTGRFAVGNSASGVEIHAAAYDNIVGPGNVIAYNVQRGVYVYGAGSTGNTITQNSIHSNAGLGIQVVGTDSDLAAPTVTKLCCFSGAGTAGPDLVIEVFSDSASQGRIYVGTTNSNSSGEFDFSPSLGFFPLPYVTLTATDHNGNTSQFSTAVATGCRHIYVPLVTKSY